MDVDKKLALDRLFANGFVEQANGHSIAAGESGLKASGGNSGEVPKRSSGLLRLYGGPSFPLGKDAGPINLAPTSLPRRQTTL